MTEHDRIVLSEMRGGVLMVTLNRPKARNAMNGPMVTALQNILKDSAEDVSVRAIVLRGAGGTFCAGGDISDMATTAGDKTAIAAVNRRFGTLIEEANRFPKLLVTVLEGAAMGGGFGLACVSDVALATENCRFAMPEVAIGLIPAQIAPFVVQRIGLAQARYLALTGIAIDAGEAYRIGLIHHVETDASALEARLDTILAATRRAAPNAQQKTKTLVLDSPGTFGPDLLNQAAADFAEAITSPEGAEGTAAFVQKRLPSWAENGDRA